MRKLLSLVLAISLIFGGVTFLEPQTVKASGFKFSEELESALEYLNEIRRAVGVGELKLDPYLVEAAQNHANYMHMHNIVTHSEDPKKEGFTGRDMTARVNAVGYEDVSLRELVKNGAKSLEHGIDSFMETAYHRLPLIGHLNQTVGFGIAGDKMVILLDRTKERPENPDVLVYPYDGQEDVYTSFLGESEDPNPLVKFNLKRSGTVISYYTPEWGTVHTTQIKDSKGNDVPHFTSEEGWLFLFPKSPLKEGETYTVTVKYGSRTDTWSFTTKGKSSVGQGTPKDEESSIDPSLGKQFVDFEEGRYWSENMLWAISRGLIAGYEEKDPKTGKVVKLLKPKTALSEAQFLTILFRYGERSRTFTTSPKDKNWWASQAYVIAEELKLPVKGSHSNREAANAPMTRGEMAVILASYYNIKHLGGGALNEYDSIMMMYELGLSNGYPDKYGNTPKTYESYGAKDILLREHIVTFMRNYDVFLNNNQDK